MAAVFKNYTTVAPTGSGSSIAAAACAAGDSVAVGDLLVATVWIGGVGNSVVSVSDTQGMANTWNNYDSAISPNTGETQTGRLAVWYCIVAAAMTSTDTVTAAL